MRGVLGVVFALLAVAVSGQEATDYTTAENPFQAEYAVPAGQPITLRVDIQGVMIESIAIDVPASLPADGNADCTVRITGANEAGRKVQVAAVLLLEDADSQALERLTLSPFRVKSKRPIAAAERLEARASSLAAMKRVYVFLKID
jgi:hypothetical protein